MFSNDRDQIRLKYLEAWQAHLHGKPLDPLQQQIVAVLIDHPEYQPLFTDERSIGSEFSPEQGHTNPFLHMGMHLAVRDQLGMDRPTGIRDYFQQLLKRHAGNSHEAEHNILDCLGESLWKAQQAGSPPDEAAYLECIRALLNIQN